MLPARAALAILVGACSSDEPVGGAPSGPPRPGPPDSGDDTALDSGDPPDPPEPPVVTEETLPGFTADDAWIFDPNQIHDVALTLSPAAVSSIGKAPFEQVEAGLVFDGLEVPQVGFRLRGKIGSFRDLSGKPKIAIDFNQFVDDQRFFGLESLALNNSVQDCSFLREVVGYRVFEAAGLPVSRMSWARVSINGADYGLYQLVEVPDDRFLRRVYEDPSGNLYDGKYVWYGGYHYTLLDFASGVDTLYQLEEGTDVGWADITAISEAHLAHRGTKGWYAAMDALLDWPSLHKMWAAEQWVGHVDGYCLNRNNYRVYFRPEDGRAQMLPWDLDNGFIDDWAWGMSWANPSGTLAATCFQDGACRADHVAAVEDLIRAVSPAELVTLVDEQAALIAEDVVTDPRRECDLHSVASWQAAVRGWTEARHLYLRGFWGL